MILVRKKILKIVSLIRSIIDFGSPYMVWLPLHTLNFWILLKIRPSDLLQALSVLAQPSVSTLKQVSPLRIPRSTLTAKFFTTTLQYPGLPVFQRVFNPWDKTYSLRHNLEKSLVRSFKFHCLSSILSTVPPWLFSSPNIILSLTKFPRRSTPQSVYRPHFQVIINSYTNPTICYVDDSKTKDRADFAFSINDCTQAHRHRNTVSSLTTELQAIFSCLEYLLTLSFSSSSSPTPIIIISDSLAALSTISTASLHPLTTRTHALIAPLSRSFGPQGT